MLLFNPNPTANLGGELREVKPLKKGSLVIVLTLLLMLVNAIGFAATGDKLLKSGMRGEEVRALQMSLMKAGVYEGKTDGIFGSDTLSAVQNFQRIHGLTVDGVAGRETWVYLERASKEPSRYSRELVMKASAYTAYDDGNSNRTCRGNPVHKGIVAVDPKVIPLGTRLYISNYGYAIADDIGGSIKGNRIDLAFESRNEALQFGVQTVTVLVLD